MKIKLITINVDEIKNKVEKHLEEKYKDYTLFSTTIKKYLTNYLIETESLQLLRMQMDIFDDKMFEELKRETETIKFYLNGFNPYTFKPKYDFAFVTERKEDKTDIYLEIKPLTQINHYEYKIQDVLNLFTSMITLSDSYTIFISTIVTELTGRIDDIFFFTEKYIEKHKDNFDPVTYEKELVLLLSYVSADELYEEINNKNEDNKK